MENGIKTPHGEAMCSRCGKDPIYCTDFCAKEVEFPPNVPIKGNHIYKVDKE